MQFSDKFAAGTILSAALMAGCAVPAFAGTSDYVSNLTNTVAGNWGLDSSGEGSYSEIGQEFYSGSTSVTLNTLTLDLYATATSSFTISLYEFDSSLTSNGGPGTLVASFDSQTLSTLNTASLVTFTPTSSVTLAAGTNYFIVLSGLTSNSNWCYTTNLAQSSSSGMTITDNLEYNYNDGFMGWVNVETETNNKSLMFGLNSSVPEPSAYAFLGGLGALGFVLIRRKCK
jgi:hypothetical protein